MTIGTGLGAQFMFTKPEARAPDTKAWLSLAGLRAFKLCPNIPIHDRFSQLRASYASFSFRFSFRFRSKQAGLAAELNQRPSSQLKSCSTGLDSVSEGTVLQGEVTLKCQEAPREEGVI